MSHNQSKRGFTIIELTLAMAFLSILLLAIITLIIQLIGMYDKGVTLQRISQAGQTISSDLEREINQSSNVTFVSIKATDVTNELGGRVCTGINSYVWNYGKYITNPSIDAGKLNVYQNENPQTTQAARDLRFVTVKDPDQALCKADANGKYPPIDRSKAQELLQDNDRNAVLHSFAVSSKMIGTQTLYAVTFSLGTNNADERDASNRCKPPTQAAETFCAVNQFDFTARTNNTDSEGGS